MSDVLKMLTLSHVVIMMQISLAWGFLGYGLYKIEKRLESLERVTHERRREKKESRDDD